MAPVAAKQCGSADGHFDPFMHAYTGFIELWQLYKAGLDKHTHIHTNKTLHVSETKENRRKLLEVSQRKRNQA